jgi:hypothetical protein
MKGVGDCEHRLDLRRLERHRRRMIGLGRFDGRRGIRVIQPDCWQNRKNARTYSSRFRAEFGE